MHQRHLLKLIIAAAGILIVAILISNANDSSGPKEELVGERLLSDAQERLSSADDIKIASPDGEVELRKSDDVWHVATKDSYPADSSKLGAFLRGLAAAKREEPKTANSDLFPRMDLGDAAKRLTISANDKTLLELLIGKFERGTNGETGRAYVYLAEDGRAWLISGLPEVSIKPLDWIKKEVVSLSRDRIMDVSVQPANAPAFRISRADSKQSNFTLEGLDPAEELVSQSSVNAVANAASYLSLEDVRALGEETAAPVSTLTYDMFDGLSMRIDLRQPDGENGGYWIALSATYDADRMKSKDAPSVAKDAPPDGAKEAEKLNKAWAGWLFKLADFKAGDLSKTRADLVKAAADTDTGDTEE